MKNQIKHVVIGISGGVDSAVAAILLKKAGFRVTGVFMRNWDITDETGFCTADKEITDASKICAQIGIPLIEVNFVKEYWNYVFSELLLEYEIGNTPNPDILCNRHIKFDYFYEYARKTLKADAIATGHYAQTSFGTYLNDFRDNQNVQLLQSVDTHKDQTFFLSQIPQKALRKTMFPVGNMTKNLVRKFAATKKLDVVANKADSTGICFIGKRPFSKFISEYLPNKPGDFVDIETGAIVGSHVGVHHWTLGQRTKLPGLPNPYFIARKDLYTNNIYVASGTNNPYLYTKMCFTQEPHWIDPNQGYFTRSRVLNCKFRFQHTKPLVDCQIYTTNNNHLIVNLSQPIRAITPGQFAVFYLNMQCLGSARIINSGQNIYYK